MIGEIFGKLKVLRNVGKNKRSEYLWLCECECGNEKIVKSYNLKIGKTKSCGCLKTGIPVKNRVGKKIGLFTVVGYVGMNNNRTSLWNAICDCGNFRIIRSNISAKSCGCLKKLRDSQRKGDKNPNWNPNLTDFERTLNRDIDGYDEWSLSIKSKYNFTCFVCNDSSGGNLVSHHLESYSSSPDTRIDISNGVCLCNNCHITFHKKYGYKANTKEQFIEHLKKMCIFDKILLK